MGWIAHAGEKLDNYRFQALSIVGAGLVAVPALLVDWERDPVRSRWMVALVIIGVGMSVLAPFREKAVHDTELSGLKDQIDEAAGDAHVYYRRIMLPTIEKLHTFLKATGAQKKAGTYSSLLGQVLGDAMGFLATDKVQVKVNYYRLGEDDNGLPCLDVADQTRGVRRQRIDASDEEGREIMRRTLMGKDEYCEDLRTRRPDPRDYTCYISVSVRSNGYVYGMLSANTETVGGIQQNASDYLAVVAGIMAIAENHYDVVKKLRINHDVTFGQPNMLDNENEGESEVSHEPGQAQ